MEQTLEDFPRYRQADVRWHIGLAETTGSRPLVTAMTEAQGQMSDLISHIAHPPELLAWANQQHARMLARWRKRDGMRVHPDHDRAPAGAPSTSWPVCCPPSGERPPACTNRHLTSV